MQSTTPRTACRKIPTLTDVYQSMIEKEEWDKIFVVLPQSNYVDDGVRDMTMADEEARDAHILNYSTFEEAGLADRLST